MDSEILYVLVGIIIFSVIAIYIFKNDDLVNANTKDTKRAEIINSYKKELYEALKPLENDKNARVAKKSELLKKFSDELSMNIFFDNIEIREIILDLADDY